MVWRSIREGRRGRAVLVGAAAAGVGPQDAETASTLFRRAAFFAEMGARGGSIGRGPIPVAQWLGDTRTIRLAGYDHSPRTSLNSSVGIIVGPNYFVLWPAPSAGLPRRRLWTRC